MSAVRPFMPLAIAYRVSSEFAIPWARSASPYDTSISTLPARSTRTTPEKPVSRAIESTASSNGCMDRI